MKIGLQLYSVRNELVADFEGTLKAVHDIGYSCVEFAGLYGKSAQEVKELCRKYDLIPISAHVALQEMETNPGCLKDYQEIGCQYVAVPYLPDTNRPNVVPYTKICASVKKVCEEAKSLGMQMLYHNHDFEFYKLEDGRYFLDALYEEIPSELLETELDTCWVKVAGESPVEYLKKYSGRAHVVHLKDFYKKGESKEGMYELIGIKPTAAAQEESFGFRPIGHGLQDIPAILKAAKSAGAEYLIVEQDRPTPGEAPLEEVKKSRDYLKQQNL